jgi:hypothetical protein
VTEWERTMIRARVDDDGLCSSESAKIVTMMMRLMMMLKITPSRSAKDHLAEVRERRSERTLHGKHLPPEREGR